jgi:hypothetical protein
MQLYFPRYQCIAGTIAVRWRISGESARVCEVYNSEKTGVKSFIFGKNLGESPQIPWSAHEEKSQ